MKEPNARFFKKLKDLENHDKLNEILLRNAEECRQNIVNMAPMRTGQYRSSIQLNDRETPTGLVVEITTDAKDLANWLEYGTGIYRDASKGLGRQTPWHYYDEYVQHWVTTHGMQAQPHWTPAFEIQKEKLKNDLKGLKL